MKSREVPHVFEMLNAESGHVKLEGAKAVCARVRLGIHCGDCMCSCKKWEDQYSRRVLLDSWHAKKAPMLQGYVRPSTFAQ